MPKYGPSIKKILSICHTVSEDDVCKLGVSILDALEALHSKGLVYNNLSKAHVLIGDHRFINKEEVRLIDFSRAREFINEKGEVIKNDGVIYNPNKAGMIGLNLYDPMNDVRDLLTFLKSLSEGHEYEKLEQMAKLIKDMENPEFHKLKDILQLQKAHEYSWTDLTILEEHQPFKKISNIIEESKHSQDFEEEQSDGDNSDSSAEADEPDSAKKEEEHDFI